MSEMKQQAGGSSIALQLAVGDRVEVHPAVDTFSDWTILVPDPVPDKATERKGWAHPHLPNQGLTSEWWTPPSVFDALGLEFELDPCAPALPAAPWIPARRRYSLPQDGLALPWAGAVWLNPPYGREAGAWVNRLAQHGDGIALVFSRTDVAWWHAAVPTATAVCFIRGRLTFIAGAGQSAPGNSGGPSALIAYGHRCADAVAGSGLGLTYWTTEGGPRCPHKG